VVYHLLERPWVYRLSQRLLAPGAQKVWAQKIQRILAQLPPAQDILDIGCGPSSCLWRLGLHPIGVDVSPTYTASFRDHGEPAITASATALPFPDASFDGVWSFGLLHHVPEGSARQAVAEMLRVARPGGYIVLEDAVMPEPAWRRPVAWTVRKLDRGGHMRNQQALEALLVCRARWVCERFVYSFLGYEDLLCIRLMSAAREKDEACKQR
jgi:SAM-dependent methyltransferase